MTVKEQRRSQVLMRVQGGAITLKEAAVIMGVSVRHARRLKGVLARLGPAGLAHGNRGRASTRRTAAEVRAAVVRLYQRTYQGCNHQHFTELLAEREGLSLSVATVRRTLKEAGLGSPHRRRPPKHRSRRERMSAEGMLLQLDGSPYRWLGPGGPKWSLLGAVDDATSDPVAGVFREEEDAAGYMLLLRQVVACKGIPAAVYHDRHSIFRVPERTPMSLEEELAGEPLPTQFGRLLVELGIQSIAAFSPQAKGRVERPWRTHQDRLAVELRLAGVQTISEANAFLPGYLARYRTRFAVPPASSESAYVPLSSDTDLDRLFCFKYTRTVAPDNTIRFGGRVLQVPPGPDRLSYARARVEVHEHLDGSVAVWYQGQRLLGELPAEDQALPVRTRPRTLPQPSFLPEATTRVPALPTSACQGVSTAGPAKRKPATNHPWRRYPDRGGHFH